MKVLLSALRGEAVMFDDMRPVSRITAAGVEDVYEDSPFLPADAEDWLLLDDITEDQARSRLDDESAAERVLTLFLPLFDSSLSRSCRVAIAGELELALASKPNSLCKVRGRFHSAPFPVPHRLEEALSIAGEAEARTLNAFLRILSRRQPLIAEVAEAWAQIPLNSFPAELDPEAARSVLVTAGSFTRLVECRAMGWLASSFYNHERSHPVVERMPGRDAWFYKWTMPFYFKEQASIMSQEALDAYTSELAGWKNTIMELAHTRPEGARQAALLLKNKQLEKGHARYAAMSLCDLAIRAKSEGLTRMQLVFAEIAVRANPHDPQCHTQFADALKKNRQLERALAVYEEVSVEYPNDDVAMCGKAEVLRDLNRLPEALQCYEDTIAKHDDVVARNGKANVLGRLGRFDEALMLLPTEPKSKQDWIGYHMRGMILLRMRNFDDAKFVFDRGCSSQMPRRQLAYFKTSKAICLMCQHQSKEALRWLPEVSLGRLGRALPVLRGHALVESGETELGLRVLSPALNSQQALIQDAALEVRARFVDHRPNHDMDWLLDCELELLALVA